MLLLLGNEVVMPNKKKSIRDPFAKREAKNYENPIPSREYIIEHLYKRKKPASFNDLIIELKLDGPNDRVAIKRRVKAMLRDEQLQQWGKSTYWPADQIEHIKGRLILDRGQLCLKAEQGGSHIKVKSSFEIKTYPGDDVVVALPSINGEIDYTFPAEIIKVVTSHDRNITGRFVSDKGFNYVISYEVNNRQEILIPAGKELGAVDSDLVMVILDEKNKSGWQEPLGEVIKVIGQIDEPKAVISSAVHNFQIPNEWPEKVELQISKIKTTIPKSAITGRLDLRDKPFVTIDGDDAKDFDDAVLCEVRNRGGFRLFVAIADVSHYVKPGSALDNEAINRGTSVYFPSTVVPMLPEVLSNGLCSLRPHEDKLVLVCEMTISDVGKVTRYSFHNAIMSSHARLTYTEVEKFLYDKSTKIHRRDGEAVVEGLWNLHALFLKLKEQREERGAIDFDSVETKIVFGKQGKIKKIEPVTRGDSHRLIEECMLSANVAAAKFILKNRKKAIYRNHLGPTDDKLSDLRNFLSGLGLKLTDRKKDIETLDYSNLLRETTTRDDHIVIQRMILRSMSQACYESDNAGHFGLAYDSYTHYTSPIRRYPDLVVHRLIKDILNDTDKFTKDLKLDDIAQHSSYTERRADDASRDVVKTFKCQYMLKHLGKEYEGVVSGVTQFGIFVEIKSLYVDGLVHVSSMGDDYYHFNPIANQLVGELSNTTFKIGTVVKIIVARVDTDKKRIDFDLVQDKLTKLGAKGKTKANTKVKGRTRAKMDAGKSKGKTKDKDKDKDKKRKR
jgi:ribonuclease R